MKLINFLKQSRLLFAPIAAKLVQTAKQPKLQNNKEGKVKFKNWLERIIL